MQAMTGPDSAGPAYDDRPFSLLKHTEIAYPRLTRPVWIAWGREAQVTPVSDANLFIRTRRQSHLKVFDRCGLLPHVERPEEFLAYLGALLEDLKASSTDEQAGVP